MGQGMVWASTRYSRTRKNGANHTIATKLTEQEYNKFHYLAVDKGISDYEYLRCIVKDKL